MQVAEALDALRRAHARGRLAQAYLVTGDPERAGRDLAVGALRMLFCAAPGPDGPCGDCAPCARVADRTHADTLWIAPQMRSRVFSVDQIRDMKSRMQQTSFGGGWKTCVLAHADRLNPAASNAILKLLEEPTGSSLFLLLTEQPQHLLPTIASRCQTIMLHDAAPAPADEWEQRLTDLLVETAVPTAGSPLLAALARARRLSGMLKEARDDMEKAAKAEAAEAGEDLTDEALDARAGLRVKEIRDRLIRRLLAWQRDQLLLVVDPDGAALQFPEHRDALAAQCAGVSRAEAVRRVLQVETMQDELNRNLPDTLVFETGFPRLVGV